MKFGDNLRLLRKKRGLTQNELSKILGISRSYYSDIENGRLLPSSRILFEMNKVLKIFTMNDVNSVNKNRRN
jgi:transcriptional regulator with XRE-family HTH domain